MPDQRKLATKRKVIRSVRSPMNPKVWCCGLECGHDVWMMRKPRDGSMQPCEPCSREPIRESAAKADKGQP